MHIQSLQQSPSFAVELHQAASGRLGQIEARQVATPSEAQQLAQRQDAPKGEGLLARLGAALVRPFVAIMDWLGKLLGSHARTGPQPSQDAQPAVMSSAVVFKQMVLQQALPMTLKGLDKASEAGDPDTGRTGPGALPPGQRRWGAAFAEHRLGRHSCRQPGRGVPYPGWPPARTEHRRDRAAAVGHHRRCRESTGARRKPGTAARNHRPVASGNERGRTVAPSGRERGQQSIGRQGAGGWPGEAVRGGCGKVPGQTAWWHPQ